jgi:hypothetical protein
MAAAGITRGGQSLDPGGHKVPSSVLTVAVQTVLTGAASWAFSVTG